MIQKKCFEKEIANISDEKDQLKNVLDDINPLVSDLRDDFHKSNRRLDELNRKALNGENIMSELLEVCHPERAGLNYIDNSRDNMFIMGENGINIISDQDIPAALRSKLEGNGELTDKDVENLFGILLGDTEDKELDINKGFQKK